MVFVSRLPTHSFTGPIDRRRVVGLLVAPSKTCVSCGHLRFFRHRWRYNSPGRGLTRKGGLTQYKQTAFDVTPLIHTLCFIPAAFAKSIKMTYTASPESIGLLPVTLSRNTRRFVITHQVRSHLSTKEEYEYDHRGIRRQSMKNPIFVS